MSQFIQSISFLTILICLSFTLVAQEEEGEPQRLPDGVEKSKFKHHQPNNDYKIDQSRICPPSWWVGMKNTELELLIYDQDIASYYPSVSYDGVSIKGVSRLENENYLFVMLDIAEGTRPGTFSIELKDGSTTKKKYNYELKPRNNGSERIATLSSEDFIYLIMPDRFANGDASNDVFKDMHQKELRRDKMYFRHGGDLQGILDKLDYLEELGVTALWLNPVLENDQPYESYHGYAISDHYNVDRRFGDNDLFVKLTDECQKRGIKMIMDIIHNHVGDKHWFIQDIPSEDWLNQWDEFTRTTYRAPTLMDPHVSDYDKKLMSDGWFDNHMPDLNQRNPHLARYLIQNNIWWIEYAGLDGYRIDTYAYPDQAFMADWGKAIQKEYPDFHMFAETWVHGNAIQSHFTENNNLTEGYNSYMPAVTDFQLYYAINEALQRNQGWTEGAARIYFTLAKDFLYENADGNVVFLDNHDLSRFYSMIGENDDKFKSGIAFLLTTRGIPMMYYGTEILLKNYSDPDGKVRQDFPGGWKEDKVDKFKDAGRTPQEQEIFSYVKRIANYRKNSNALKHGKLKQFVPVDGLYAYFRYTDDETIMVIMNTHEKEVDVPLKRFSEMFGDYNKAKEIVSGELIDLSGSFKAKGYQTQVFRLVD